MPRKNKLSSENGGPTDEIRVDGLRLRSVLGVRPDERAAPRDLVAHVRLGLDLAPAARSDDLADTVDWASLCDRLRACAARRADRLAETLADALAREALADPRVAWVRLRLEKPGALADAATASISVFRTRPSAPAP
ncbi:MAG: dihydroneopterin aldolase [Kiritimatiellae bacterium]|nr:dihydroneopterin aldolase [Kiritimatiellia bacterium]